MEVAPRKGGKLEIEAEQGRGLLGGAKREVALRVTGEEVVPAFEVVRGLVGRSGERVVAKHAGGAPWQGCVDVDLGGLEKGARLIYRVRLVRARDRLGFEEGATQLTLH